MDKNYEILSDNKNLKASITYRSAGFYLVELFRWTKEVVSEFGFRSEFFCVPFSQPSITDTLETAKELSMDLLKNDVFFNFYEKLPKWNSFVICLLI